MRSARWSAWRSLRRSLTHQDLFLSGVGDLDNTVHEYSGRDDMFGLDRARLDDMRRLDNGRPGRHGHQRREVPRRLVVDEVTFVVGGLRLDQRHLRFEPALLNIVPALELGDRLALGKIGAVARRGVKSGNAGATRA